MIKPYFAKVKSKIKKISPLIKSEDIAFDMVSTDMGIIKGRISFIDGSIFDFREIVSHKEHDYRFHWMDKNNSLLIRWDSAPHHKNLKNFPFHKHTQEKVESSKEIYLTNAIDYIKKELIKKFFS